MPYSDILTILLAGLTINAVDVGVTLMFAAQPWNKVLQGQGIKPSPFTPPFYIFANFVSGALLVELYRLIESQVDGSGRAALVASISLWFVTRLYGAGHAVMRQMPWRLFAIMSAGLGAGCVLAGQLIAYRLG